MEVTKPAELRKNQKEYLKKAYDGEVVLVVRPRNENVVIMGNSFYNRIMQERRIMAYYVRMKEKGTQTPEEEKELTEIIKACFGKKKKGKPGDLMGVFENEHFYMSDDFDDPLECFKEYM